MVNGRTDTAVRAEGAERYVQGVLMLKRGIVVSQASQNMPGYDLIAHNLENGKSCRIQVKYRKAINSDGMRFKNFDFDFVIYVAGNLGRVGKQVTGAVPKDGVTQIFVIPRRKARLGTKKRGLYRSPTKGGHEKYRDAWHLIDEFLGIRRPTSG